MEGNVVKAAKVLGGCIVVASLILTVGFHPMVTGRILTFTKIEPAPVSAPGVYHYTTPASTPPPPPSPTQAF